MIRKALALILLISGCGLESISQDIIHTSIDETTKVEITFQKEILMDVFYHDSKVISKLKVDLNVADHQWNLSEFSIEKQQKLAVSVTDPVPVKFARQELQFSQLLIDFSNGLKWELLIGDEGIAYRWILEIGEEAIINNEVLSFHLDKEDISYFPKEVSMISHYERLYLKKQVDSIPAGDFCSLPVLFQKQNGQNVLFTETDLFDYPCLFLEKREDKQSFQAMFPNVIMEIEAKEGSDRNQKIIKEATYIAKTAGNRNLPWRIFTLAAEDKDLAQSNMVYQLASPLKLEDTEWIKPGKVAWDWWNANNIIGVNFKSGLNNDTYKYYIDFAAEYGLEYIILDEGWSKSTTNIMEYNPEIDVEELVQYGSENNVGIILWTLWGPLDEKMDEVMSLYESWGVKGVKVDFMQRADQYMVKYYERVAESAAKHHLLVDFHGAFKPAGLRKAYPNVVNYEGLKGLENAKWSDMMTPEHNLTLPFIRMVAGPMDYTPGAMDNAHQDYFSIRWNRPMSMGTRCHQVAMYVIYDSPLQMLCDNPSNYYREKESTAFISRIPTTWNETIVLDAKIGEYILMARRHGNDWYIAAMCDEAKSFDVKMDFLYGKEYEMSIIQDGINADKNAQDYKRMERTADKWSPLIISMEKGGGFVAILKLKN